MYCGIMSVGIIEKQLLYYTLIFLRDRLDVHLIVSVNHQQRS